MTGTSKAVFSQRTAHGPGRFAAIQKTIVGEAAGGVVRQARRSSQGARSRELRKVMSLTKPMRMPKRNFRSACIKPTGGFCEPSKRHSLG